MHERQTSPSGLRHEVAPGIEIQRGLSEELIAQLIEKSKQAHIRHSTPKDVEAKDGGPGRFASRAAYDKWAAKGRDVFALVGPNNDLGGIIWYGPEEMPKNDKTAQPNTTFAIRLYEGYVGKKLAVPFMQESMKEYAALLRERGELDSFTGVWLETDTDNEAARYTYERVGYENAIEGDERVLMFLTADKVAEICEQPPHQSRPV